MSSSTVAPTIPALGKLSADLYSNSSTRAGGAFFLAMLVAIVGRTPELMQNSIGTSFYHFLLLLAACLLLLPLSGGVGRASKENVFWALLLLQIWYTVGLPFSNWRSGSLPHFLVNIRLAPVFLFGVAYLVTRKQLRGAFYACAVGLVLVLGSVATGGEAIEDDSRLRLGEGSFANSNELASYLMLFMPFWFFTTIGPKSHWLIRLASVGLCVAAVGQILKTGSRGGLILLGITTVIVFIKLSLINKVRVGIPALLATVFLFVSLPQATKLRLLSFGKGDVSAIASKESRTTLLLESIDVTLRNPVFGVGFGVYQFVAGDVVTSTSHRRLWQSTHNAYTQVSAESGVPALVFYVAALVYGVRQLLRSRKMASQWPQLKELYIMADSLLLSLTVVICNGFFANTAHDFPIYVILGLTVALHTVTKAEADALASGGSLAATPLPALPAFTYRPTAPAPQPAAPVDSPVADNVVEPSEQYGNVPWRVPPRKASAANKPPVALQ